MNFSDAIKYITREISKDSNLQFVYRANIAFAFTEEYRRYCDDNHKYDSLSREDIYIISKRAAKHFLDMWLLNADKEG